MKDDSPKSASNDDILKAVLELAIRSATLEEKLCSNTNAITEACSHLKAVEMQVQSNEKEIKGMLEQIAKLQQRCDNAERYSRCWNLRLYGMKETPEEKVKAEVTKLFSVLAPEDKEKMGFLIDMMHRVGAPRDNSNGPIIIQFNMRSYRSKICKIARDNSILKEEKLRFKEDLNHTYRNRQWPLVEEARKQGKRAGFCGPNAYVEGKKIIC